MQKKVESVLSAARMLIRTPSESALPQENMRLLLHNLLERYTQDALRANEDFATHEFECSLEYSENLLAFDVTISGLNDNSEFDPVALYYQPLTADEESGDWFRVPLVDYESYAKLTQAGKVVGSFYSNNWDGIESLKLKLNIDEEAANLRRWRLAFRLFPDTPADYGDYVAFPARFTPLLETALAIAALPLVLDDSPSYTAFRQLRYPTLMTELAEWEARFKQYLDRPVNARIVDSLPWHYLNRNRLVPRQEFLRVERG